MDMKHEDAELYLFMPGIELCSIPWFVAHASAPNLRRIGFIRVDVYHPPGKMRP